MKINKIKQDIDIYVITPDETDTVSCGEIFYMLNNTKYSLSITGDLGRYSYEWGANDHETFAQLMSRVDEDYLLSKLANPIFDLTESIAETIRCIKQEKFRTKYKSTAEICTRIKELKNNSMFGCSCESEFHTNIIHICPGLDFETIQTCKSYSTNAKIMSNLFIKHIQPGIEKELRYK